MCQVKTPVKEPDPLPCSIHKSATAVWCTAQSNWPQSIRAQQAVLHKGRPCAASPAEDAGLTAALRKQRAVALVCVVMEVNGGWAGAWRVHACVHINGPGVTTILPEAVSGYKSVTMSHSQSLHCISHEGVVQRLPYTGSVWLPVCRWPGASCLVTMMIAVTEAAAVQCAVLLTS